MAVTYPNPLIYGVSTSNTYDVRSLKTDFGDGYQEVTPDGINYITQKGTLVHSLLPIGDTAHTVGATTLRNFLKANCGTSNVVSIKNMMEDPTGNTNLNVFLTGWSEKYDGVLFSFSVQFREAFNE